MPASPLQTHTELSATRNELQSLAQDILELKSVMESMDRCGTGGGVFTGKGGLQGAPILFRSFKRQGLQERDGEHGQVGDRRGCTLFTGKGGLQGGLVQWKR